MQNLFIAKGFSICGKITSNYLKKELVEMLKELELKDLPGNVRNSFHASFRNAVWTRIGQMKISELEKQDISEETVMEVVAILKNKAKYNPKWAEFVFEVPDEMFRDMVDKEFDRLREEEIPQSFSNMYKHLCRRIKEEDEWMPIPTDVLVFKRKFDYLAERNGRPSVFFVR